MQSVKVESVRSDINVTPLVDVVLVLLIIFMVITPMLQKGPPVIMPKASNPLPKPEDKTDILVTVNDKKVVFVEKDPMQSDQQFADRIAEEYIRNKNAAVILKGDARLTYGDVKKVMLKVKDVGFEQVGLITQRQDQ